MLKKLIKQIIRKMAWTAKKNYHASIDTAMKTGWQSRIRSLHFQRYRKIIFQTHLNIKELTPYFSDFDNIGNYLIERHL